MEIFVFISQHYIWFLIAAILIFLAIIGYYADTTNFGLGKTIEDDKNKNKIALENMKFEGTTGINQNYYNQNIVNPNNIVSQPIKDQTIGSQSNQSTKTSAPSTVKKEEAKRDNLLDDEMFNKFSEEFDMLLPKKQTIADDLLTDISDLDLGKTQKFDFSSFSSFDNIELPEIKQMEEEPDDIWKL